MAEKNRTTFAAFPDMQKYRFNQKNPSDTRQIVEWGTKYSDYVSII